MDLLGDFYVLVMGCRPVVRKVKGLDLVMFPVRTPVFDCQETAQEFCDCWSGESLLLSGVEIDV